MPICPKALGTAGRAAQAAFQRTEAQSPAAPLLSLREAVALWALHPSSFSVAWGCLLAGAPCEQAEEALPARHARPRSFRLEMAEAGTRGHVSIGRGFGGLWEHSARHQDFVD